MPPADPAGPVATEVRTSTIAGRGSFAAEAVAPGRMVLQFSRPVASLADLGTLNHSCDPTLAWSTGSALVARRAIAAGEELTVDYSTAVADPGFVLYCHCGSTRCRQAVEGTDWRIPQLQTRYAGQWAPGVQRLIDSIGES